MEAKARVDSFTARLGLQIPILLAPMAGSCPVPLSAAVARAGGMGGCGALLMKPEVIRAWAAEFREESQGGAFQINLWIPDPPPARDAERERRQREFLSGWGPAVTPEMGETVLPDFEAQCEAMLEAKPTAISSIMGVYPPRFVAEMKARGILWFATATTVAEARAAEAAGADVIVAQGMEAGGHRGAFKAADADAQLVGLIALVPQVVDAVSVPVVATGGIADARGVAAALMLGASAAQIGTGFLRCPEAKINPTWADRIGEVEAHETRITRAFTGRSGRAINTRYVIASTSPNSPHPAAYPVQRGLTRVMREEAAKAGDTDRMQMWAGQGAPFAQAKPAEAVARELWSEALELLG
ncbi:MAG: nitronate monooxygenase [Terracidiphilus sp.]